MRRIVFIIAMMTSLTVGARDKVVNTPVFAEGSGVVVPRTIILGQTATTVGIRLRTGSYTLSDAFHLVACNWGTASSGSSKTSVTGLDGI